jgi:hypothetical protein
MMADMKHRIIMVVVTLAVLLGSPMAALARQQEDAPEILDARLEGFSKSVTLSSHSTALVWFAFLVLAFIALVVLFKNARRTHLD